MTKTKQFWTLISFITFLLFTVSIYTKLYWLNIFVIALGLLVNKKGTDILFPNYVRKREQARETLEKIRKTKEYRKR